jgi:alpha-galactosidase
MTKETREILTNKEVVAIDQDALGIQGFPAITEDGLEVWVKPLSNDEWAVCFLNRSNQVKPINFDWKENFIKDDNFQKQLDAGKTSYKVRDLWAKKDLGTTETVLRALIPSHDVLMFRLTR